MRAYFAKLSLAAALGLTLAADAALADTPDGDRTFERFHGKQSFFIRYPGDRAVEGGTVRVHGPDKGPYIERCFWTAQDSFYGLPLGLTQHCYRHTLENTPAPQ